MNLDAIIAAHQSGQGYKAISRQFGVQCSTVRKIIHNVKALRTAADLPRSPRKFNQDQTVKFKSKMRNNPGATDQTLQALFRIFAKRRALLSEKNMEA